MDLIIYIAIFMSGAVFGSFFSLAVYRLPRKENITYVRSHCTTCNHNLNFLDLIPILSYIFLGGKCRYCKDKIRPRYILLEIFSGLVFLIVALSIKITSLSSITDFITLFFIYLFTCVIFITGGIDKENKKTHDGTLLFGVVISCIRILYNSFMGISAKSNVIGFIAIPLAMLIVSLLAQKAYGEEKTPIGFGDIKYISIIGLFLGFEMQLISLIISIIISAIISLIKKEKEIPFAYYLSIAVMITIILKPFILPIIELLNFNIM